MKLTLFMLIYSLKKIKVVFCGWYKKKWHCIKIKTIIHSFSYLHVYACSYIFVQYIYRLRVT